MLKSFEFTGAVFRCHYNCFYYKFLLLIRRIFDKMLVEMTHVKCTPLKIFTFFMHMQFIRIHVYSLSSIDSCPAIIRSFAVVCCYFSFLSEFFVVVCISKKPLLLCIRKERVIFVVIHFDFFIFFYHFIIVVCV